MSQKIQTKLNDQAHLCQAVGDTPIPCGYHQSRVHCQFIGIEASLLASNQNQFHTFLKQNNDVKQLAKWFTAKQLPAGSWYLVKEQRTWLEAKLTQVLRTHPNGEPFHIMIAGVASYVHAFGQLFIIMNTLSALPCAPKVTITFADKCAFPLEQIQALLKQVSQRHGLMGYRFKLGSSQFKCPNALAKLLKKHKVHLRELTIHCVQGDLTDETRFTSESFNLITEHFLTSLLYKNFAAIAPIRKNYQRWLKPQGTLLSADGIRKDSDDYNEFVALNQAQGLTLLDDMSQAVWDPYGLPEDMFQSILEGPITRPIPVELDNTLSGFIKHD